MLFHAVFFCCQVFRCFRHATASNDVIKLLTGLLHDESLSVDLRVAARWPWLQSGFSGERELLRQVVEDGQANMHVRQTANRALSHSICTSK